MLEKELDEIAFPSVRVDLMNDVVMYNYEYILALFYDLSFNLF